MPSKITIISYIGKYCAIGADIVAVTLVLACPLFVEQDIARTTLNQAAVRGSVVEDVLAD